MIFIKKLNFRKFFTSKKSRKISAATVSKSPAAVSKSSEKRLWTEFKEKDNILKARVSSWLAAPENVFRWEATIISPASCPYKNGVFNVSVYMPTEFPFEPPKITFKTKIFHPNINKKGEISVDILGSKWSPVWTINLVLLSICSVLSAPVEPFFASNPAVKLYRKDRKARDNGQ